MARIALVNVPFRSHVGAMLRLANSLTRQGHELRAWAPERNRSDAAHVGAALVPHNPILPTSGGTRFAADQAAVIEMSAEEVIPGLHAFSPDLVIRDSLAPWGLIASEYLGLPCVVSYPMFPTLVPGMNWPKVPKPRPEPTETALASRERFDAIWLRIARRWGVEMMDFTGVFHDTPETTLTYTTEEMLGAFELRPTWHCIGPMMSPSPAAELLPERPVVYACLGTSFNHDVEAFSAIIAGLAREPVDVIVSTGGTSVGKKDLEPLPANCEVHSYLPGREMLARASVHVTHGGCNSVHESLLAAVPMICLPQAVDQIPLSARIEELGVGLRVAEDPTQIRDAVRALLGSAAAHARARELRDHLLAYDGDTRLAAVIDGVLTANGVTAG